MANFDDLLNEQKKTNKILAQQQELLDEPEFAESAKRSAAEIATDWLVHRGQKKFAKDQGMHDIDNILVEQGKVTRVWQINTLQVMEEMATSLNKMVTLAGGKVDPVQQGPVSGSAMLPGRRVASDMKADAAAGDKNTAKYRQTLIKSEKKESRMMKWQKSAADSLKGMAKGFGTAAKATIVSVLVGAAMVWFLKFMESDTWKKIAEMIAGFMKTGLPKMVGVIGSVLSGIGSVISFLWKWGVMPIKVFIDKVGGIFGIKELVSGDVYERDAKYGEKGESKARGRLARLFPGIVRERFARN